MLKKRCQQKNVLLFVFVSKFGVPALLSYAPWGSAYWCVSSSFPVNGKNGATTVLWWIFASWKIIQTLDGIVGEICEKVPKHFGFFEVIHCWIFSIRIWKIQLIFTYFNHWDDEVMCFLPRFCCRMHRLKCRMHHSILRMKHLDIYDYGISLCKSSMSSALHAFGNWLGWMYKTCKQL